MVPSSSLAALLLLLSLTLSTSSEFSLSARHELGHFYRRGGGFFAFVDGT